MKKSFFSTGFNLKEVNPEIGKTYPVFGILNDLRIVDGQVRILINSNIEAEVYLGDKDQLKIMYSRIFDTGIFFIEVKEITPDGLIKGFCSTIIFGKSQAIEC